MKLSDQQIDYMVGRFLAWKLPKDFQPDAGISYEPPAYLAALPGANIGPTGTNLLTYAQAREMVRHMLEGMPVEATDAK